MKVIPTSIRKRISEISSNEQIFQEAISLYQNTLKVCGFNEKLALHNKVTNDEKYIEENKKRKRKIIWYNPPYSLNVKTNIGRIFFKLLNKHFPPDNLFHKIFNRNTVKISYSCMKNISSIISSHNKILLNKDERNIEYGCNCRRKNECPMENKCLTPKLVYQAIVSNDKDLVKKKYIGLTETPFKERYRNHKKSFNNRKYHNETELSKYIWSLKDDDKVPSIHWSILKTIKSKSTSLSCQLCLMEKLIIINNFNNANLLNKRSEFISKCRHTNKFLLSNVKDDSKD